MRALGDAGEAPADRAERGVRSKGPPGGLLPPPKVRRGASRGDFMPRLPLRADPPYTPPPSLPSSCG